MEKGKIVLDDRLYTDTHEWLKKVGDNRFQVGITDHAQHELKDIYVVDLPKIGGELKQFEKWGDIESEKGKAELCSPIAGKVVATNHENLGDVDGTEEPNPRTERYGGDLFNINKKPYETWLVEIETNDEDQLEKLLEAKGYKKLI